MTRRRWIADRIADNRAYLAGQNAAHLARVLRAKPGQQFDIAAEGVVRTGTIISITSEQVEFELGEPVHSAPLPEITVVLAIFKFDRMEWAIEKCVELGASGIVPVIAQRTELHLATGAIKRVDRWRRIARQASEQSRRGSVPEIAQPVKFKEAVTWANGTRIVLAESEEKAMLKDALPSSATSELTLAFGPEGGWTEGELELFRERGWILASLGSTILRAETAAIAATAIALAQLQ